MAEQSGAPATRQPGWYSCCEHCNCGQPNGIWPAREGHDDTCWKGCNDVDLAADEAAEKPETEARGG